ncbi:hypothetical protein C0995_005749 [Termitomyces sp. Mi166|nr:hypothetical protein C0995_005749 [Termitomyces sp. Mi166\
MYLRMQMRVTHHNVNNERDYSHFTSQASESQGGEHYPAGPKNNVSNYGSAELEDEEIEPDDNANTHCLKLSKNKKKASQHKANVQKSRNDFQHLQDTVFKHLPDEWETVDIDGQWEHCNDFRGILHPDFFWSSSNNHIYAGKYAWKAQRMAHCEVTYVPHTELLYL